MNASLRVPLASVAALLLVAIGASATRQLSGGAVSIALAVPVVVWLGLETTVIEGAVGAVVVGVLLDASAGGPGGLLAFLSVLVFVGVRAGAGTFDARTPLGFGLLSGVATLGMGLGALLLLRYVSPEATAPGFEPPRPRDGRGAAHRARRAGREVGARPRALPGSPGAARVAPVSGRPWP